jgi:hypothetical protein
MIEVVPGGVAFTGVFTYLYEQWSQEGQEKQKYREILREEYQAQKVREKYDLQFVKQITGIESDQRAEALLYFCNFPPKWVLQATEYEVGVAIKDCYKDFKEVAPPED